LGRTWEAIACFEAALAIDPNHRARQRLAKTIETTSSSQAASKP
jgi:hypothetical protein